MPAEQLPGHPRVAVVMEVPPPKDFLFQALKEASIPVAVECHARELESARLSGADVILVSLDEAMEPYLERVTDLALGSSLPVVFDDFEFSRELTGWERNRWLRHLRAKITGSSDTRPPLPAWAANSEQDRPQTGAGAERAPMVWVLGASIGGPEALRRFLEAMPEYVPAAFVMVQHMGPDFQRVLRDRLQRVTALEVVCAEDGQALTPGRVIIAGVGRRLGLNDDCTIRLGAIEADDGPLPSIDRVLFEVSAAVGADAGAIIFSGRDRDGLEGCGALKEKGGAVWVQDAGSAAISIAGDALRETGLPDFSGSPEQLAARVVEMARARQKRED